MASSNVIAQLSSMSSEDIALSGILTDKFGDVPTTACELAQAPGFQRLVAHLQEQLGVDASFGELPNRDDEEEENRPDVRAADQLRWFVARVFMAGALHAAWFGSETTLGKDFRLLKKVR